MSPALLEMVVEAGVDLSAQDSDGYTLLMMATMRSGWIGSIRALLDKEVNVNAQSTNVESALMIAIRNQQNVDIIRSLIVAGADVNQKDNRGMTPLEAMISSKNSDIRKLASEVAAATEN